MKISNMCILLCMFLVFAACTNKQEHNRSWEAKDGYVPDKETAIKIAEVVLLRVYGETINKNKPFKAVLKNNTWFVEGTLHTN